MANRLKKQQQKTNRQTNKQKEKEKRKKRKKEKKKEKKKVYRFNGCQEQTFFFPGALSPHKPYGLLGTGQEQRQ